MIDVNKVKDGMQRRLFSKYIDAGFTPVAAALVVTQNILETAAAPTYSGFNSNVFLKNNNIGGVTWSPNLGAQGFIKGTPRPISEGGYYVKFPSVEACADFIINLYRTRYTAALTKTTIVDFVTSIKDKGYFTATLDSYISGMKGKKDRILDPYIRTFIDAPLTGTIDLDTVVITASKKKVN